MKKRHRMRKTISLALCSWMLLGGFALRGAEPAHGAEAGKFLSKIEITATVDANTSYAKVYDEAFYDEIMAKYEGGYETEAAALEISTAKQLAAFARAVNIGTKDFSGKFVRLANDIDLKGTMPVTTEAASGQGYTLTISNPAGTNGLQNVWEPIGSSFQGTFDGNNKKIQNMVVLNEKNNGQMVMSGFFGSLRESGTIRDLGIEGGSVISSSTQGSYAGGLVGWNRGI